MKCPECGSEEWEKYNCGKVIVDKCKKCEGIWFDGGEFTFLIEQGDFYATSLDEKKEIDKTPEIAKKCPKCNVAMKRVTKHGVRIDICRDCKGIWTDKGEFLFLSRRLIDGEM